MAFAEKAAGLPQLVYQIASWLSQTLVCCQCVCAEPRQDNLTAEMSQEWKISVSAHLIRSKDYKGRQQEAAEQKLLLPFDAATPLGVLFMALPLLSQQCRLTHHVPLLQQSKTLRFAVCCKSVAASRTCSREPLMCWTRLFPALPRLIWSSVCCRRYQLATLLHSVQHGAVTVQFVASCLCQARYGATTWTWTCKVSKAFLVSWDGCQGRFIFCL